MTIKYKLCTLLIMLLTASAQAAVNTPVVAAPKAKAFYRDDQIWPTTNIPVCWENLATIVSKPIWKQRRISTLAYVNAAWGDSNPSIHKTGEGTVSLLRFTDTNKKCPLPSAIPVFTGIRILASATYPIILPSGQRLPPPYTKALESKLKNLLNGVALDLDNKLIYEGLCRGQSVNAENCFKAVVIHEFGHVIGMSHEHNRIDQPLAYTYYNLKCAEDDPSIVQGQLTIGNLRIGSFDTTSIMNYCNANRVKSPVLSNLDTLGVRIFYSNMPTYSTDLGYPVIRIPLVIVNGVAKSITMHDQNKDGYYTYTSAPTANRSSNPPKLVNGVLSIPNLKVTSFGKVKAIQKRSMKLVSANLAVNASITNLYSTLRQ
jgi:hypothetical protein